MLRTLAVLALTGSLFLVGCGAPMRVNDPVAVNDLPAINETTDDYYIQVGDVVRVEVPGVTDTNLAGGEPYVDLPVRPDGKIYMPLLKDEVTVAGYTPAQARENLLAAYTEFLTNPVVNFNLLAFAPREVYVTGEVTSAARTFEYRKSLTVLRAVAAAGHDTRRANLENVIIVRTRGAGNMPLVTSVNLKDALTNLDPRQDIALMPNDVVFVPRSGVVNVNDFIEQYISRMIPLPGVVTVWAGSNI